MNRKMCKSVQRNYSYETGSITDILEELKWETLQKRRKDNRLILLYKGLKGKARIPTDDLIPKIRRCRNQHSLVFQIPTASKDAYKENFFPQTIRDWNFSHTFVEKIEKSIHLLPVCKLYPTLLALLSHTATVARLLMKDKKSTRLNSNVSSQSNRSTVLQAKLLPCYDSGKPEFNAGKHCGNIKFLTSFSLETF